MIPALAAAGAMSARDIVALLGLTKHLEGGWYRETFRDERTDAGGRAVSTLIYYLLEEGEISAWHRVDAVEVWHYYAGASLALTLSPDGKETSTHILGADLAKGERPQCVVPRGCWQTARSQGAFTLVGCSVAPGFQFSGFEMAPKGWAPGALIKQ